jgi:hypothetical protein
MSESYKITLYFRYSATTLSFSLDTEEEAHKSAQILLRGMETGEPEVFILRTNISSSVVRLSDILFFEISPSLTLEKR